MAEIFSEATIYALSSGRPPAAIAVVRISGPRASHALEALIGRVPQPRVAMLANLKDGNGELIDEALVLWFPAPNSETGEDVVELQPHGSRAALAKLFDVLSGLEGFRAAGRGEFTRRAVLNGKIDLTAAEGLLDLINADTEGQRKVALRHLKGQLGARVETWRRQILDAMALVEAGIDFSDEGDVPQDLVRDARARAAILRAEMTEALRGSRHGERVRDGLVVAIAGPPNAGKSTLMNALARREVAIVSPVAGTTRDVIEVHLDLGGWPVTLLDTAGMRDSDDAVEQEGVRRARARLAEADLVLWLDETGEGVPPAAMHEGALTWHVRTKSDLGGAGEASLHGGLPRGAFAISARTGQGLGNLIGALGREAERFFAGAESTLIIRQRQRELLTRAAIALGRALNVAGGDEELFAEELRVAAHNLGMLTGRIDVEDVLDVIFAEFCIGK